MKLNFNKVGDFSRFKRVQRIDIDFREKYWHSSKKQAKNERKLTSKGTPQVFRINLDEFSHDASLVRNDDAVSVPTSTFKIPCSIFNII